MFSAAEVERKALEGESGLERRRIWLFRNWSLRSIIVGAEEAISDVDKEVRFLVVGWSSR